MLQPADIDAGVRHAIETGMGLLALALAGLLAIAYLAALLDRADRAPRTARLLCRIAPPAARRAAALLLAGQAALASAVAVPSSARPAHAAVATSAAVEPPVDTGNSSVRSWLQGEDGPAGELGVAPPAIPAAPAAPESAQPERARTARPPAEREMGSRSRSGLTYSPATGSVGRAPTATTSGEPQVATRYVIRPGDSLWRIASRRLATRAPNREIDAAWRRIYEANRAAIGPNPGLIHPGSVLELPAPH